MASIPKKRRKVNKRKANPRIKRSRAAKKGWRTRREKNPELLRQWRKKQSEKKARIARKHRSVEERIIFDEATRRLQDSEIEAEVERRVKKRVAAREAELERVRSEIVKRAIATTIEEFENHAPAGFVFPDTYTAIRTRMDIADFSGDPEVEAGVLADEFNIETRDIYTIWYGSDPSEG